MVGIRTIPVPNITAEPETGEIFFSFRGRVWSRPALDRFIVGHLYGSIDFKQSALHLALSNRTFLRITPVELEDFWNIILYGSNIFRWWSSKNAEDDEVQRVLEQVRQLMLDAEFMATVVEDSGSDLDTGSVNENLDTGSVSENLDTGSMSENLDTRSVNENLDTGSVNENLDTGSVNENLDMGSVNENLDMGSVNENLDTGSVNENLDTGSVNKK